MEGAVVEIKQYATKIRPNFVSPTTRGSWETNYPLIMIHGFLDFATDDNENGVNMSVKFKIHSLSSYSVDENARNVCSIEDKAIEQCNDVGKLDNSNNLVPFTKAKNPADDAVDKISRAKNMGYVRCHSVSENHELNWPISDNGEVKIFAPVKKGKNLILLSFSQSKKIFHEMHVNYEPMNNERFVRPVYIICEGSDGKFEATSDEDNSVESAVKRLAFNARILQTFTGENLNLHGFGRKSFRLEEDEEGDVKVNVFKSKLDIEKALEMTGDELYRFFKQELSESELYDPLCKFWAFMSCTRYKPPEDKEKFDKKKIAEYVKGHTALGGDNLALFGTGCLHTWARNLEELVERFTDERKIDCKVLFDDSCNRGYHWANYSTTLGAAIHELGHTFNLPHTSSGIMSRGFDNMNCFFTCQHSKTTDSEVCLADKMCSPYKDFGAHWHRSSAAILNYCRWFGNRTDKISRDQACPVISFGINERGPVGGGCKEFDEDSCFDLKSWLDNEKVEFGGLRIKAAQFVDAIQFIGRKIEDQTCSTEVFSPWYGNQDSDASIHEFRFISENEKLIAIDVRAGAWIDAIRLHSTCKSSVWFGGRGGNLYKLKTMKENDYINGIFGTTEDFVMSLGVQISCSEDDHQALEAEEFYFESSHGIRVIEAQDKQGEVIKHWEFTEVEPRKFLAVLKDEILQNGKTETVEIYDGGGAKSSYRIQNFIRKNIENFI